MGYAENTAVSLMGSRILEKLLVESPIELEKLVKWLVKKHPYIWHSPNVPFTKTRIRNVMFVVNRMGKVRLINKKRITVGPEKEKTYEISIDPFSFEQIRDLLRIDAEATVLISGFGELSQDYKIPDLSLNLLGKEEQKLMREAKRVTLGKEGYVVHRKLKKIKKLKPIICFTTEEALKIRKEKEEEEELIPVSELEIHIHDDEEYQKYGSPAFEDLEETLVKVVKTHDLLLDLTPLSKYFSFKLQEYSKKYNIPSFYIGKKDNRNFLIWNQKECHMCILDK